MTLNRVLLVLLAVGLLSFTAVSPVSAQNEYQDIPTWIDDIASDNNYYGIEDPLIYFSGDTDPLNTASDFGSQFNDDSTIRDFYKAGDYSFNQYPQEIVKWNEGVSKEDFRNGGWRYSNIPWLFSESTVDSGRVKDAYVGIFSVDPMVIVHSNPQYAHVDPYREEGEFEKRVGTNVDVRAVSSARLRLPKSGVVNGEWDTRKLYSTENFEVNRMRLYAQDCGDGIACRLATDESGDWVVSFEDVSIPANVTDQTLTIDSEFVYEIEEGIDTREWDCETKPIGPNESRPSRPDPGPNDKSNSGWDCDWTEWEDSETNYLNGDTKNRTVATNMPVNVESPQARAEKAVFPERTEEYYIKDLQPASWSQIKYENTNGNEELAIESVWEFFSARDKRWDVLCQIDGGSEGRQVNSCPNSKNNANNLASRARPIMVNAYPQSDEEVATGPKTQVISQPRTQSTPLPTLDTHPSCAGECNWYVRNFENLPENKVSYSEPQSIVIRRAISETDKLWIYGLAGDNKQEIEVSQTRQVHRAIIKSEILLNGAEISEEERENARSTGERLPNQNQVKMKIKLYEINNKTPISTTDRSNEKITISTGVETYEVQTNSTGEATLIANKTDSRYEIKYDYRKWYNVPDSERIYQTRGPVYDTAQLPPTSSIWASLLRIAVVIAVPYIVIYYFAKLFGVNLDPRQWI